MKLELMGLANFGKIVQVLILIFNDFEVFLSPCRKLCLHADDEELFEIIFLV